MKLTLVVVFMILLLSLTSVGKRKQRKHVWSSSKARLDVGGKKHLYNIHNAEFMVGMVRLFREYHEYICAGVIINQLWALSSSSCVHKPTEEEILLGKVILRGGTKYIDGTGGFDHRIDIMQDTALITFISVKDKFIHQPYEMPIPVIASERYEFNTSPVYAENFGWGEPINQGIPSKTLKSAVVQLLSDKECNKHFPDVKDAATFAICAKNTTGLICDCEGGGPLVIDNTLIGIAIRLYNETNACTNPQIFARISIHQRIILFITSGTNITFTPPLPMRN